MKNFLTVPSSTSERLKIYASKDGSLSGASGRYEIKDSTTIRAVALGVLTDKADKSLSGCFADAMKSPMGSAVLYPVPHDPFTEVEVETPKGGPSAKDPR